MNVWYCQGTTDQRVNTQMRDLLVILTTQYKHTVKNNNFTEFLCFFL